MARNGLGKKNKQLLSMKAAQWAFGGKGQSTCCSGHILFDLGSDESAVCGLLM